MMTTTYTRVRLSDVRVDPTSVYGLAQSRAEEYLLSLDADRLLAPYQSPDDVEKFYPNWESMGMAGHTCGHYLSALCGMWEATGHDVLRERLTYCVDVLEKAQDTDGYLGGIPGGRVLFDELRRSEIRSQAFDVNGVWVPLYNLHKVCAGLLAVVRTFSSEELGVRARRISERLGQWWLGLSDALSDEVMEQLRRCEFGGMNEWLAHLAALTGDERYRTAAERFTEPELEGPLAEGQSGHLTGIHANTQIPKILGYHALGTHEKAVDTFWNSVVYERSNALGAHSVGEFFHSPDDFSSMMTSTEGVETCNSYNMARLAESLYLQRGESQYLDFYERVIENHILSTIDVSGKHTGFVYFTPLRPRHYRVYSSAQECFWCCVGTGLENHSRYGRMIYTQGADECLYVNLFIPSTLHWREAGLDVQLEYEACAGAENSGVLRVLPVDSDGDSVCIYVRRPRWVTSVHYDRPYETVQRGDVTYDCILVSALEMSEIHFTHMLDVHLEQLPDGSDWACLMRGCEVMAVRDEAVDMPDMYAGSGRASHVPHGARRNFSDLPVFPSGELSFTSETNGRLNVHMLSSAGEDIEVLFEPFTDIQESRYSIYLPWGDLAQVKEKLGRMDAREAGATRILDAVRCGQQQSEKDHAYRGKDDEQGVQTRRTRGWFDYELARGAVLTVQRDGEGAYELYVNGRVLEKHASADNEDTYVLDLIEGLDTDVLRVRISAVGGQRTPWIRSVTSSRG